MALPMPALPWTGAPKRALTSNVASVQPHERTTP